MSAIVKNKNNKKNECGLWVPKKSILKKIIIIYKKACGVDVP